MIAVLIRMRALLTKEFMQLLRDPRMRFFVVVPPIIQLLVFGYAATFDVREADVGVVDWSQTQDTRELMSSIAATGHYNLYYFANMDEASDAMDRNRIRAILQFPADFDRTRKVQLISDGSDSNSAQLIEGQLTQALSSKAAQRAGVQLPVQEEQRAWYNPNLDDRNFFVPGIIVNVVLVATMILTAMTVVREREMGTLERLMVTPVSRLEFVIGKVAPVACVGLFDVMLVTAMAVLWFEVPFRGSLLALIFGSMLYLMSTLGLGLLISAYSGTQQQAMLLAFFVIMPFTILSGFAFPIRNMPMGVQYLSLLDPMRYYLVVIRDLFLKGGGIGDFGFEFGMMGLLGGVALGLSVVRVR